MSPAFKLRAVVEEIDREMSERLAEVAAEAGSPWQRLVDEWTAYIEMALEPEIRPNDDPFFARAMTLVVDGYNDDPRELVDIPEVRTLLRRLEAEWPYWAFFFNQVDDSIKLLLSCVAGARYLGRGAVEMDADLVTAAMARAFGGMNAVFERFNFPEDELELMSRGFVEVLQQAGMG